MDSWDRTDSVRVEDTSDFIDDIISAFSSYKKFVFLVWTFLFLKWRVYYQKFILLILVILYFLGYFCVTPDV